MALLRYWLLTTEELKAEIEAFVRHGKGIEILENDCEIIEFLLDNCDIEIPEENTFLCIYKIEVVL